MSPQRFLDVLYLLLVSALWVALGTEALPSVAATVLAVPLCLVVPGYLASLAALPRGRLLPAERTMYTLALSISIVILAGLALDLTVGITTGAWAVALGACTLVAALVAIARNPPIVAIPLAARRGVGGGSIALLVLGAALATAAVALAGVGAKHDERRTAFAQLALVPPSQAQAAPRVALTNVSQNSQGYAVRVTGSGPGLRWHAVVKAGGTWTSPPLPLSRSRSAPNATVTVSRDGGGRGVYRQVTYPPGDPASLGTSPSP